MDIIPHKFLHVEDAMYLKDYKIFLKMDDGAYGIVDLEKELWGEVFEPLKDKALFSQVRVDPILGTIAWPNGADLSPEFLREQL